jgi:hypothetical protein
MYDLNIGVLPLPTATDADIKRIIEAAAVLHVSEFDIFCLAYCNWFGQAAKNQEMRLTFECYVNRSVVPVWVRDFTRKIQQNDIDPIEVRTSSESTFRSNPLAGICVLLLLFTLLGLLVYLAVAAQEIAPINCGILPPCY